MTVSLLLEERHTFEVTMRSPDIEWYVPQGEGFEPETIHRCRVVWSVDPAFNSWGISTFNIAIQAVDIEYTADVATYRDDDEQARIVRGRISYPDSETSIDPSNPKSLLQKAKPKWRVDYDFGVGHKEDVLEPTGLKVDFGALLITVVF